MNLSEKLKYCRTKQNFTQSQVAEKLHISRKTVSGWENARSFPDISSLVTLSKIYKVSLDDLLNDDRLLEEYASQNKKLNTSTKITNFFYYVTLLSWLLGYIEFFNYEKPHFPIIFLILIISTTIYLSHFSEWGKFKNKIYAFKAIGSLALIFIFHIIINMFILSSSNFFSHADSYVLLGFLSGRLLLILGVTFSFEIVLFFKPKKI